MTHEQEAMKTYIGLRRTNDLLLQRDRKKISQYNLSLNEFAVLEMLYTLGPNPIQKIRDKILVASSSTTYIVDKLCKEGLVERKVDENDGRVFIASLTKKGYQLIESIIPDHTKHISEMFEALTEDELKCFRKHLRKISDDLTQE